MPEQLLDDPSAQNIAGEQCYEPSSPQKRASRGEGVMREPKTAYSQQLKHQKQRSCAAPTKHHSSGSVLMMILFPFGSGIIPCSATLSALHILTQP
jgi:ABC-type nickel/cobalt efflux system permease component RcnA